MKSAGTLSNGQSEQVFDLRRENGHGDSAGEAYHDGIGDVFDDGTQMEYAQQNQEHAGHDGGHKQACFAVLLYDAVDDDDKSTRRSADLHTASAKQGHGQSGDDGRDDALFGCHPRSDTESDGQRQGHDADDEPGHDVGRQLFLVVTSQVEKQFRLEFEFTHNLIILELYILIVFRNAKIALLCHKL